jgi:hypothetical protein
MTIETPAPTPSAKHRAFTVRNFIDEAALKADVTYSLANLSDGFQRQAGFIVHYSTLAAKAARQVDDIELLIEATESAVFRQLRDDLLKIGDKFTDTFLNKSVAASSRVLALKRALNEAKQIQAIAKGAVEAFKQRKDMLVQEGAASRTERQGELRMNGPADMEESKKRLLVEIARRAAEPQE